MRHFFVTFLRKEKEIIFPVEKCGITPNCLYCGLLTLIFENSDNKNVSDSKKYLKIKKSLLSKNLQLTFHLQC